MERLSEYPEYGFPEQGALAYLIGYLLEIGEAQSSGSGITAIDWREIKAWSDLMGITLSPGESKTLRKLSGAYVVEFYRADGHDCSPPCIKEPDVDQVENKLKKLFSMLRRPKDDD